MSATDTSTEALIKRVARNAKACRYALARFVFSREKDVIEQHSKFVVHAASEMVDAVSVNQPRHEFDAPRIRELRKSFQRQLRLNGRAFPPYFVFDFCHDARFKVAKGVDAVFELFKDALCEFDGSVLVATGPPHVRFDPIQSLADGFSEIPKSGLASSIFFKNLFEPRLSVFTTL
jgi:hypothetical protein